MDADMREPGLAPPQRVPIGTEAQPLALLLAGAHDVAPGEIDDRFEPPAWLGDIVLDGLSALLALRLPGTPPEDAIEATAQVWIKAICYGVTWQEEPDGAALRHGFALLAREMDRWPAPRAYLDRVPKDRPWPYQPPRIVRATESQRAAGIAAITAYRESAELKDWLERRAAIEGSLIDDLLGHMRSAMAASDRWDRIMHLFWIHPFSRRCGTEKSP
jgi:hypothetical protein